MATCRHILAVIKFQPLLPPKTFFPIGIPALLRLQILSHFPINKFEMRLDALENALASSVSSVLVLVVPGHRVLLE
jgi:hypothetical protein